MSLSHSLVYIDQNLPDQSIPLSNASAPPPPAPICWGLTADALLIGYCMVMAFLSIVIIGAFDFVLFSFRFSLIILLVATMALTGISASKKDRQMLQFMFWMTTWFLGFIVFFASIILLRNFENYMDPSENEEETFQMYLQYTSPLLALFAVIFIKLLILVGLIALTIKRQGNGNGADGAQIEGIVMWRQGIETDGQ
ncbi:unnamed protein product [Caenorhabditis sp. 36 PRJEB53466]|nr:unnamed protein product [Caenorhabditis sp. 36 PRJEB53466]